MQEYKSIVSEQAEKLLSGLPARVSQVHGLVEKNFQIRQPSALTASYTQVIKTGGKYDTNDVLHGLVSLVGEEVHNTLEVLQKISAWILLLVPKIADGNNFGVEVQKAAYIHVKDSIEKWQKVWDGLTDYYNQRATAIEKIKDKISKEKSSSSTSTKTTGGKDGDEDKTVALTSEKETITSNAAVDDWIAYVVAVDVKWYFNLLRTLEGVRDQYAVTYDIIEKNKDKILLPRGNGDRGYSSMF